MNYDFDKIIDRKNSDCIKYDFNTEYHKPLDVLPMWVADMDFQVPNEVSDSLAKTVNHSIFGYSDMKEDYFTTVKEWFNTGFNYSPEKEWLVKTPGIVFAIANAIIAYTVEGDSIMIQQPVYYPFASTIKANNRKIVDNTLIIKNGQYCIDFEDFENKIKSNNVKLFILCSPHNPVGRVWTMEELTTMGKICIKYNVLVVADEIHCDFVYNGYQHHNFPSISPQFADNTILCTAPSKTFNLAGLQVSNIFIKNKILRDKFNLQMDKIGYSQLNIMGLVACKSAYKYGRDWVNQLNTYLQENLDFTRDFFAKNFPQLKIIEPQGTYLLWVDFSELKMSPKDLDKFIINEAKLWLDDGCMFGMSGANFQRFNIACPRSTLAKAFQQLYLAVNHLNGN